MDQILFFGPKSFITASSDAKKVESDEHEIRRDRRISTGYPLVCGRLNLLRLQLYLFLLVFLFHFLARLGEAPGRTYDGFIGTFEGDRASITKVDNVSITVHVSQCLDQIIEELPPTQCSLSHPRPNFRDRGIRDRHQESKVP